MPAQPQWPKDSRPSACTAPCTSFRCWRCWHRWCCLRPRAPLKATSASSTKSRAHHRSAAICAPGERSAFLDVQQQTGPRREDRKYIISLGGHMQSIVKTLFVGAILAIGTSAAFAADPVVGTWKLNLAKSTFSPGPAPKSQTRNYAESAQGITVTVKTIAADGKESTTTLTFKDDGKPYPMSGSPDVDTV